MKRLLGPAALSLALVATPVPAGGHLACRTTVGEGWLVSCYAEQSLLRLGPVEIGAGAEVRNVPEWALLTPYLSAIGATRGLPSQQVGYNTGFAFSIAWGYAWK